jgi:hypothetical protein
MVLVTPILPLSSPQHSHPNQETKTLLVESLRISAVYVLYITVHGLECME